MNGYQSILSGIPYYFGTKNEAAGTVRYVIKMKDDVDGAALEKAVQTTFQRYPYLKKTLVRHCADLYLKDNPAPIAVLHTDRQITLNSPQTNNQLIAICWEGRYIYFNNSHGMMDGRGRKNVLRTLLYYYCTERYGEPVQMDDVLLAGTPIDPAEYEDPFENPDTAIQSEIRLKGALKPLTPWHAIHLSKEAGIKCTRNARMKLLRFREADFMKVCKTSDATPNTSIALVLMRAIDKMYPNSRRKPVASVCMDTRAATGMNKTHLSATLYAKLAFHKCMREMDFNRQNTILRGQLMLGSDSNAQKSTVRTYSRIFKFVRRLKAVALKDFIVKTMVGITRKDSSFMVSYAGKVSYGDCDRHIHGLVSCPFVDESEIMIEITVADGYFYVSWTQFWDEDTYIDAFTDELDSLGIESEVLAAETIDGPMVYRGSPRTA